MKQKLLEMSQVTVFIIYYCLVLQKPKRVPELVLGRQNWVTSTGGRHNLVPGLHLYRQGPAWSVINVYYCTQALHYRKE